MKYQATLTLASLALAVSLLAGCGPTSSQTSASGSGLLAPVAAPADHVSAGIAGNATSGSEYLSDAEVKQIALKDAGLEESAVTFLKVRLDYDNGRAEYDVEFYSGTTEYDYEIDAVSGQILSVDRDIESYTPAAGTASNSGTAVSGDIGEAAAKQAALSHAGLSESDVAFVKVERDYDDGRHVYEVEFYHGTNEYVYEIAASDGSILSYGYDAGFYTPPKSSGASVTAEQAKQLAFSHAGVNEADVRALEMDTDHDDGRTVYEFEWKVGRTEYSCEIDASTGAVVSFEKEVD